MSRFELETFSPSKKDHFHAKLASVFVGCENEIRKLHDYLHQASNGSGNFIVISGEAGTGKSTLVKHFSKQAEDYGALTIEESFAQNSRFDPYAPFFRIVEIVRSNSRDKTLKIHPEIAKILKIEKSDGNGNGNRNTKKDIDLASLYSLQTQYGLMQQRLSSALIDVTKGKLLVLILSDVHLAPQSSWQFIHYLSKSLVEQKILVLVSLRQDGREIQQEKMPVYADVLQRMNRERLVDKIQLDRFTEESIRKYLNSAFKRSDFSNKMIPLLYEISSGIPGTLEKCLKTMYEEEIIYEQNGIWFNKENLSYENVYKFMLDEDQIKSVSDQLLELSEKQTSLLRYASLMNGPFDYGLLGEILNISRVNLAKELVYLKERKILNDFGEKKFQFKRSEFAQAIKEQIEEGDLISMHELIALSIETSETIALTEKTYLLAHHYYFTEDKSKAFRYLRKAFDRALENFAFTEAKEFYNQSWNLYKCNPEIFNQSEILYLLLKMVWLNRVLGLYEESISNAQQALEICKNNSNYDTRNQILIQKGLTYFRLNDWDNSQKCFSICLEEDEDKEPFVEAMANFGLGNVHLELSKYGMAKDYYEKSIQLAKKLDAKPLVATLYNNLGIIENILGNRMKSISFYSQSIPMFEKLGDNFGLARIYHNIGMTYADENSWIKANDFYGKSLKASDVMGLVPLKSVTFLNRALALIHLKNYEESREYNYKALRLLERLHDELGIAEYHKIQGILERTEENWQDAKDHFDSAVKMFEKLKNKLGEAETKFERGILSFDLKEKDEMVEWLNKSKAIYKKLGLTAKVEKIDKKIFEFEISLSDKKKSIVQKKATV